MSPQKKSSLGPPPRPADLVLLLDRVQLGIAVLLDERGHAMTLPMDRLPRNPPPAPGDLIRVPLGETRRPFWDAATVDRAVNRRTDGASPTAQGSRLNEVSKPSLPP